MPVKYVVVVIFGSSTKQRKSSLFEFAGSEKGCAGASDVAFGKSVMGGVVFGGGASFGSPARSPPSCHALRVAICASVRLQSPLNPTRVVHSVVVRAPNGGMMRACVSETIDAAFAFASS